MKIVNTGQQYRVYDDSLQTFDELPPNIYTVRFSKMGGFFLEKHSSIEIKEEKVYGVHNEKIEKVLKTYERFDRNFGIILSGDKGMGKSLFAKMLTETLVESGKAVILVDDYYPGIASYINSIEQNVAIIFDEFDKTFYAGGRNNDGPSPQDELLTLLDGFGTGKKMFVVTCNDTNRLSDYFVNRTGRFHYHFRFEYPTAAEVKEYMEDNLEVVDPDNIRRVISFSTKVKLNYDSLRAIVFELNCGEKLEDAFNDLNIMKLNRERYIFNHVLDDNTNYEINTSVDLFAEKVRFEVRINGLNHMVEFDTKDIVTDYMTGISTVDGEKVKLEFNIYNESEDDKPKFGIKSISIRRPVQNKYNYTV